MTSNTKTYLYEFVPKIKFIFFAIIFVILMGLYYFYGWKINKYDKNKIVKLSGKAYYTFDHTNEYGELPDYENWNAFELKPGVKFTDKVDLTTIWFYKKFNIPKELRNQNLGLILGMLQHSDTVYINKTFIGKTGLCLIKSRDDFSMRVHWNNYRHYEIPKEIIKDGNNELLIRICTNNFSPYFREYFRIVPYEDYLNSKNFWSFATVHIYNYFISVILIMGLIFFTIYYYKRNEIIFYYYSLFSISTGIYLFNFNYSEVFNTNLLLSRFFCCFAPIATWALYRIITITKDNIYMIINRIILLSILIICIINFSLPYYLFIFGSLLSHVFSILILICTLFLIIRKQISLKININFYITILLLLIISSVWDNLVYYFNLIPIYSLPITMIFVVISIGSWLIIRIVYTMNETEKLNITLEDKVKERTSELQKKSDNLEKISNKLLEAQEKLWSEIEIAEKIQTSILPEKKKIPGYEIALHMKPTQNVGGDYYDIINCDEVNWVTIGDVSGHGVPAGLIMMMVQSTLRSHVMDNPSIEPSKLISVVNNTMAYNIKRMNEAKFMTITAFSIRNNGEIFFSGRHEDIIFYNSRTEKIEVIKTDGILISPWSLGKSEINLKIKVEINDILILYTDGLTEAWLKNKPEIDRENKMFGVDRLGRILMENCRESTASIKSKILDELEKYHIDDDITFFVLKKE